MSECSHTSKILSINKWRNAVLPVDATIEQAICNLNENAIQIVLVTSKDGTLEGTISDGDIRRGLLKGKTLTSRVCDVYNPNPLVVPIGMDSDQIMQLMLVNKIRQVPIIDHKKKIIGLHLWDEIVEPSHCENIMVVMAGGFGRRLRPRTDFLPKPMLPLNGKPMLQHIIERARCDGFRNFVLAIHYLGDLIKEYFGDGSRLNVSIEYLDEKDPLGTAGALSLLPRPNLPFIVTNGDVITEISYSKLLEFHERNRGEATMAVRLHEWQHPFGVVQMDGIEIVGFEEKPISRSHINAGVYTLNPSVLTLIRRDERCDMPHLFERLRQDKRRILAYPMHEQWLDVGCPDDLITAYNTFTD